jgi:hypothetical protein
MGADDVNTGTGTLAEEPVSSLGWLKVSRQAVVLRVV